MAKPPIIISNGGMASELARGLVPGPGENRKAEKIILENVKELNERVTGNNPGNKPLPVAMSLAEQSGAARIYWRLSDEKEIPSETGAGSR